MSIAMYMIVYDQPCRKFSMCKTIKRECAASR